jgi:hypothetical protein
MNNILFNCLIINVLNLTFDARSMSGMIKYPLNEWETNKIIPHSTSILCSGSLTFNIGINLDQ